nr:type VI secretion system baseplate subunit TssF [uncultured Chryseobacterium sp.]
MKQDRIKDRIIRRAARMWGYNELETETSFDPVISLLLSACASELEKLDFELESSHARIIERVLEIMFPEEVSGAIPARTLLQIHPLENNTEISLYNSFKTSIRKQNIYSPSDSIVKEIHFTPSTNARLTTAKINYIAYGDTLNRIESFFFDNVISKAQKHLPSGELWLGIHYSGKEDLEDLKFFIDINNTYQKELFFYYLKQVKVYGAEKEYILTEEENEELNLDNIITKNYSDLEYIYNEVNQYYHHYFFTLKGKINCKEDSENKELFTEYFPHHQITEENEMIWLRFKFSEAIVPEILQNVRFALNCVPAINIRNYQFNKRIKGRLNIISVETQNEHFLDLDYVSDENNGKRLDIKNYETEHEGMTALLRNGGVSRFDSRNASELLQYLLELIKDETAAFSALGGNAATEVLKEINQNVASLHQAAREKNFEQVGNPYLIISSNNEEANVSCDISYWLTSAEDGNDIKPGTVLTTVDNKRNTFLGANAVMLQASVGGRKKLSPQDKILEYRSALLTRGRIVTIADIRAFGMNHFKNTIVGVEIKKGTKKEVSLKGGFSRTIDIFLIRNQENKEDIQMQEWSYLCESFLLKLKKASANLYPYRLFEK